MVLVNGTDHNIDSTSNDDNDNDSISNDTTTTTTTNNNNNNSTSNSRGAGDLRRAAAALHRRARALDNYYYDYQYYYYYYHYYYYYYYYYYCAYFEIAVLILLIMLHSVYSCQHAHPPTKTKRGRPRIRELLPGVTLRPATSKHGWSKHGSSIMPSRHSIPQDLYSPCLNLTNSARTMFTPTMFQLERKNKDPYTQPSEPILFPKLRIHFADFPYLLCSIDQRPARVAPQVQDRFMETVESGAQALTVPRRGIRKGGIRRNDHLQVTQRY